MELVQSSHFGGVQCDFYRREEDSYCMTSEQLGMALGYSDPGVAIGKLVTRNKYLEEAEFSTFTSLVKVEGGREVTREVRIFTEDGIYEVTMLARTEKAREFRAFVRSVLKAMRTGEMTTLRDTVERLQGKSLRQTDKAAHLAERQDKLERLVSAGRLELAELRQKLEGFLSPAVTNEPTPEQMTWRKTAETVAQRRRANGSNIPKIDAAGCGEIVISLRKDGYSYAEIALTIQEQTGMPITLQTVYNYLKKKAQS